MKCPKGLKKPPKRECLMGRNRKCHWFVIDAPGHYCMWKWIEDRLGDVSELTPNNDIGKALGISGTRVQDLLKKRVEKKLREFFEEAEKMVGG